MAMGSGGGGGGSPSAIRAGAAFVELYGKDDKLRAGLARAKAMVASFSAKVAAVGAGVAAAGAAMLVPLTSFFREGVSQAAELGDVASLFGMTSEQASRMAYAFETTGNSTDDLKKALGRLSETADGRPLDEFFLDTVDALLAMDDAAARMAAARDIFGERAAFKILDAGQDLRRLMGEAPLISAKTMADAEAFEQSLSKIGAAVRAALVPLVETLAPVAEWFATLVRENAQLARYAAVAGAALVVVGGGLVAIAGIATVVTTAVTGLTAAWAALTAVVAFFLTPVGLVIAGVVAVTAAVVALVAFTDTGRAMFKSLAETFGVAWDGIVDSVLSGNFTMAFQIVWDTVKLIWTRAVLGLTVIWNNFKSEVVEGWHEFADAAAYAWGRIQGVSEAALKAQIASERELRAQARKEDEDSARRDVQAAAMRLGFDRLKASREAKASVEDQLKSVTSQMAATQISATRGGFMSGNFAGAFGGSSILASLIKDGNKSSAATAKNTKDILGELKKKDDDGEVFE